MPNHQTFRVSLSDNLYRTADGPLKIEIVFWVQNNQVMGEAYWPADDLCANVVNGEFRHPFHGRRYRITTSTFFRGAGESVTLEVEQWFRCDSQTRTEYPEPASQQRNES